MPGTVMFSSSAYPVSGDAEYIAAVRFYYKIMKLQVLVSINCTYGIIYICIDAYMYSKYTVIIHFV